MRFSPSRLLARVRGAPRAVLASLPVLLALACQGFTPTSIAGPGPSEPPVDGGMQPFMTGVYLGDAETRPERVERAVAEYTRAAGKHPALVKTFHDLDADLSRSGWAGQLVRNIARTGATNFMALDLNWRGAPRNGLLAAINSGQADAVIARAARNVADMGETVLIQPGWEMNGNWQYAWQGYENGANAAAARAYTDAYRRVVDIFRREGAHNVRWLFSPNTGNPIAMGSGPGHWNWYANYYPGDRYVDYVAVHGFNGPSVWGGPWRDFGALFDSGEMDRMLSDVASRFPNKPIIIGEFATEEPRGQGASKADWIRRAFADMRGRPNVVGAVWFNMNKESDWRIDTTPAALQAYREAVTAPGVVAAYGELRGPLAAGP
jgi:endoglucanase